MEKLNSSRMVKLFSVLIAAFLWFMAMGDLNPTRTVKYSGVPVNTYGLRNGLVISEDLRKNVEVEVSGRRSDVSSLKKSDLGVSIDLSKYGAGEHEIRFRDNEKIRQNNITVRYRPEFMKVKIENMMNRIYDIEAEISGNLPEGYDRNELALSATSCTVEGPESKVMKVYRVIARLDLNKAEKNSEFIAELIPVDTEGNQVKGVELSIDKIKILIPFEKSYPVKINANIVGEPKEGYKVDKVVLTPETVNLIKENESADSVDAIETEAFDIAGISENTEKNVGFIVPSGYRLNGSDKILVKVSVKKSDDEEEKDSNDLESKVLEIKVDNSNIQNPNEELEFSNSFQSTIPVSVEVEGDPEKIRNISEASIHASLDISQIKEAGTFEAPIHVNIADGSSVKIKNYTPKTVSITAVQKNRE